MGSDLRELLYDLRDAKELSRHAYGPARALRRVCNHRRETLRMRQGVSV
jgi:hypothetical protein